MATPTRPCPYCGASVLQTATHCGNCGRPMPPSPKTSQPAKTIFGYQAPVKPAAADVDDDEDDATQISDPPAGMLSESGPTPAKTIMGGLPSPKPSGAPKLPPPVSKPVPNPASKTVFGTPAIHRPPGSPATGDASGPVPSPPAGPAPSGPAPAAPTPPAPSAPAPAAPGAPPMGAAPGGPPPGPPAPGAPAPGAPGFPPPAGAAPHQPGPPGFPPPAGGPPGMQQPGMQQPGMQQPNMQQPGMPHQPGMMQPNYGGPGMFQQGFGAGGPLPGEAFATKIAGLLRDHELHKKLLLIGGAAVALAVIIIPLLKSGDQMLFTWRTDSKFRLLIWPLLAAATFLFVALAPPNIRQSMPRWVFSAVPWAMAGLTIGIVGWGSVYNPGPSDIEVTVRFGLPILIAGLLLFKLQNASNLARIVIGTGAVLVLIFFIDHLANRMFKFEGVPALIIIRNLVIGLVLLVATASGVLSLGNQVPSLRQWDRFAGPVAALLLITIPADMLLLFLASIIHHKMGISAFFILLHQLIYAVGFAAVFIALTEVGIEGAKALFAPSPAMPYGQYPQQPYPPQQPPGYPPQGQPGQPMPGQPPMHAPPQAPPMGAPHQPGQPPGQGGQGGPGGGWPPQGQ